MLGLRFLKGFLCVFINIAKGFSALQIICNRSSLFSYGGFEKFKKRQAWPGFFYWISNLFISFLLVELTYSAKQLLLFAFYFSINFFVSPLQTQNAEEELQRAKRLMEDQARTNDDHKRRIDKVIEKAEPLKVRIKAK